MENTKKEKKNEENSVELHGFRFEDCISESDKKKMYDVARKNNKR